MRSGYVDKMNEAKYFLERVREHVQSDRPQEVAYTFSAFMSAARSVLQYAHDEAKERKTLQWYETAVAGRAVVKKFRDMRNVSVHVTPVGPEQQVTIEAFIPLRVEVSVDLIVTDQNGKVVRKASTHPLPPSRAQQVCKGSFNRTYRVPDWNGSEDLVALCEKYLTEIDEILEDGYQKGALV